MRIVEIEPQENGAHRNQSSPGTMGIPDGWALLPSTIATPGFPFGSLTAGVVYPATDDPDEVVDGIMTVLSWEPVEIPAPEPEPVPEPGVAEILDVLLGVIS